IGSADKIQKCIRRNRSPTGIAEGRSYDPRKALGAVQSTGLFDGKAFAFQEVYLLRSPDHRRAIEVGAVLGGQRRQNLLAPSGVEGCGGIADKHGNPGSDWIVNEIPVNGIEQVVLPPVRQGGTQRIAARLREYVSLEFVGDVH